MSGKFASLPRDARPKFPGLRALPTLALFMLTVQVVLPSRRRSIAARSKGTRPGGIIDSVIERQEIGGVVDANSIETRR
jgi:hypothetical protein